MEAHHTAVASAACALAVVAVGIGLLIGHAHQEMSYVLYIGAVILAVGGAIVVGRKRPKRPRDRLPQTPPDLVLVFSSRLSGAQSDATPPKCQPPGHW